MEKELQSYDVSRRLRTLLLRAVLRVLYSMHRRLCNAFVSWRSYSSRNDPWRQAEDYRRLALRSAGHNLFKVVEMARRRIQARGFKVWVGRLKSVSRSVAVLHRASTRAASSIKSAAFGRWHRTAKSIYFRSKARALTATAEELHASLGALRLRNDRAEGRIEELEYLLVNAQDSFRGKQRRAVDRYVASRNQSSMRDVFGKWIGFKRLGYQRRRMLLGILVRLRRRVTFSALKYLHWVNATNTIAHRSLNIFIRKLERRCLSAWREHTAGQIIRRHKLRSFVARWKLVRSARVLVAWRFEGSMGRKRRTVLCRVAERSFRSLFVAAWRRWHVILSKTKEESRTKLQVARVQRRWAFLRITRTWHAWSLCVFAAKQSKIRMMGNLRQLVRVAMLRGWSMWRRFLLATRSQRKRHVTLNRFVVKLRYQVMSAALLGLKSCVKARRSAKSRLERTLNKKKARHVSYAVILCCNTVDDVPHLY